MNLARSTGVLLLVVVSSILFSSEGAKNCENKLLHKCISRYRALLKNNPHHEQHCSRLQEVVSCFADDPSCEGESINRFRLWILQEAMLEAKLKFCPRVDFKSLKDSVENTDIAKEYSLVENYGDPVSSCAMQVHHKCSELFLDSMKENERICGDSVEWFTCYSKTASEQNCNSPIIKKYANFVETVGIKLVVDAQFANSCNKVEL